MLENAGEQGSRTFLLNESSIGMITAVRAFFVEHDSGIVSCVVNVSSISVLYFSSVSSHGIT